MKNAKMWVIALAALIISCSAEESTGLPRIITLNAPDGKLVLINKAMVCGVKVRWNYTDKTVDFSNLDSRYDLKIKHYVNSGDEFETKFILAPSTNIKSRSLFAPGDKARVEVSIWGVVPDDKIEECRKVFILGR